MKTKKIITLLLVAVLLISTASLIVACKDKMFEVKVDYNAEQGTVSVSPTSDDGKYKEGTELTVTATPKTGFALDTVKLSTDDQAMTPNSDGKFVFTVKENTTVTVKFKSNSAQHVCGHKCPTCGKCTDATCTDPVCAEKCPGHEGPSDKLAAGNYYVILRDDTNNLVWYVTGALNSKGGLTVSHSDETVAVLTVIYENDKYTLKIGEQYLEAYLNGTYKNMRLVDTPSSDAIEWKWDSNYNTFSATYSDETRYLGGNYFGGTVDDLYDDAVTLAQERYFTDNPVVIHYQSVDAHVCKHVCPICGKCTDATCQDPVCADKCQGHSATPTAITVNPTSVTLDVGATSAKPSLTFTPSDADNSVTWASEDEQIATVNDQGVITGVSAGSTTVTVTSTVASSVKAEIQVTVQKGFTPLTEPVAGTYYFAMKVNNDYWYITGEMVSTYYFGTTTNKDNAVMVNLIADGDGWLLKQGTKYIEIAISGTHINAVYKDAQTSGKHWTWNATEKVFVWDNQYIIGNTGSYTNIGGINLSDKANNHFAVLGTYGDQPIERPDPESVTLNKSGTLYLAPQSGNYIQLNATVQPVAASQEIEWSSSNEQVATVENGTVTYVGAGQTTITATAKGTDKKVEITVVVTEKGSEENPLTINDVIELINSVDEGKIVGDGASKDFYIVGKVDEGSVFDSGWKFSMTDTSGTVSCEHDGFLYSGLRNQSGAMDGFEFLMQAKLQKENGNYKLVDAKIDGSWHPTATEIRIDDEISVKVPMTAKINFSVVPVNASLEGIQWNSSASEKATVEEGVVTAVSAGITTITVSIGDIVSNNCVVTVEPADAQPETIFTYDWTGSLTADSVVDDIYKTTAQENDITDWIKLWSPALSEIVSFTSAKCKVANDYNTIGGFGYTATTKDGTATITTAHQIKKITLTVVPFSSAKDISFSINGKEQSHPKGDATYTGKLDCAYEVTVELDEATNAIEFLAPKTAGNKFVIVKMILEW